MYKRQVVWDLKQPGRQTFALPKGNIYAFSSDNSTFVTLEGQRVSLYELETGKLSKSFSPDYASDGTTRALVVNKDGTEVAVSQASEGLVEFWNVEGDPRLLRRIERFGSSS